MCLKNQLDSQGEVYKTVIRSATIYGPEVWREKKAQERKLDVRKMR